MTTKYRKTINLIVLVSVFAIILSIIGLTIGISEHLSNTQDPIKVYSQREQLLKLVITKCQQLGYDTAEIHSVPNCYTFSDPTRKTWGQNQILKSLQVDITSEYQQVYGVKSN